MSATAAAGHAGFGIAAAAVDVGEAAGRPPRDRE